MRAERIGLRASILVATILLGAGPATAVGSITYFMGQPRGLSADGGVLLVDGAQEGSIATWSPPAPTDEEPVDPLPAVGPSLYERFGVGPTADIEAAVAAPSLRNALFESTSGLDPTRTGRDGDPGSFVFDGSATDARLRSGIGLVPLPFPGTSLRDPARALLPPPPRSGGGLPALIDVPSATVRPVFGNDRSLRVRTLSRDGTTVVGRYDDNPAPVVWRSEDGILRSLEPYGSADFGSIAGPDVISDDGRILSGAIVASTPVADAGGLYLPTVGLVWRNGTRPEIDRRPGTAPRVVALTLGGEVALGHDRIGGRDHAVVWEGGEVKPLLEDDPGILSSQGRVLSDDGTVAFGVFRLATESTSRVFRSGADGSVLDLGALLEGAEKGHIHGTTESGETAVGRAEFVDGSGRSSSQAIVWTVTGGSRRLAEYLTARGVEVDPAQGFYSVDAISADGRVLAGRTSDGIGFYAVIPEPTANLLLALGLMGLASAGRRPSRGARRGRPAALSIFAIVVSSGGLGGAEASALSFEVLPGHAEALSGDGRVLVYTRADLASPSRFEAVEFVVRDRLGNETVLPQIAGTTDRRLGQVTAISRDGTVLVGPSLERGDPLRWSHGEGIRRLARDDEYLVELTSVSPSGGFAAGDWFRRSLRRGEPHRGTATWHPDEGFMLHRSSLDTIRGSGIRDERLVATGDASAVAIWLEGAAYDLRVERLDFARGTRQPLFSESDPDRTYDTRVVLDEGRTLVGYYAGSDPILDHGRVAGSRSGVSQRLRPQGTLFRWTEPDGLEHLDLALGDGQSFSLVGANDGASVIAGTLYSESEPAIDPTGRVLSIRGILESEAALWTSEHGLVSLSEHLIRLGLELGGHALDSVLHVSEDGRSFVGQTSEGALYWATIPEPSAAVLLGLGLASLARRRRRDTYSRLMPSRAAIR